VKPLEEGDSRLPPAKTNGNPSFSFSSKAQDAKDGGDRCQATLVRAEIGFCTSATAAHCLYENVIDSKRKGFDKDVLKKENCSSRFKTRGALWGEIEVTLPDFGTVKAIGIVNQEYYSKSKTEDTAVFVFNCPNGPGKVPVIPIAQQALTAD
jgi:hypothetical protein